MADDGWSVDREIARIADAGAFGPDRRFGSFERDCDGPGGRSHCLSTVTFGAVVASDGSRHPVVVKTKCRNAAVRESVNMDAQFHNELIAYDGILPFLLATGGGPAAGPAVPRFYYGRNECGDSAESDLIVLENANAAGYVLSEDRLFLDFDHLAVALRALAKFHGLSYTAKCRDPAGFREAIANVRDTVWGADGHWVMGKDTARKLGQRGIDGLLARNGDRYRDDELFRRFAGIVAAGDESLRRSLAPREPLAVLCHGDFCRNNVLFRYDGGGRPVNALLFDFGTPRYGSPALDVSFLLYLNAGRATRDGHWNDLLDAYCDALAAAVPDGVRTPGRTELDAEMAASAYFSFVKISFFLPCQYDDAEKVETHGRGLPKSDDWELPKSDDWELPKPDGLADYFASYGGDAATQLLADVVEHFVETGYTNV